MNSRKYGNEVIFKGTNSAFGEVGAMVSRGLKLCFDVMTVEELKKWL